MEMIKTCIDVALSWEEQIEAAKLAREEREANTHKAGDVVSDAIRAGFDMNALEAVLLTSKKWQNGRTLNVGFFDGSPALRQRVIQLFQLWAPYANLTIVHIDSVVDAHIRVTFTRGGSWSYLGTDCLLIPKDKPTMQLGWMTETTSLEEARRVCVHEWGHTIGLGHEHQHPQGGIPWDREKVYQWYQANNGWTRQDVDQQVFELMNINQTNFSLYDPKSIMHYPVPAQLLTDPSKAVGWNTDLSDQDKAFAASAYPKPVVKRLKRRSVYTLGRHYGEPCIGTIAGKDVGKWTPGNNFGE